MMGSKAGLTMKYFVLNPNKDDVYGYASRAAIRAYADIVRGGNEPMASELLCWIRDIEKKQ